MATPGAIPRWEDELEGRVTALLGRAHEIAAGHLDGINDAAEELAALTQGDLRVLYLARRTALQQLASRPDRETRQVISLIRRALEVGDWPGQWDNTQHVP